jgi:hypothetical protein
MTGWEYGDRTQTVRGEIQIDTGDDHRDRMIAEVFEQAQRQVYLLLGMDPPGPRRP